MSAKLRWLSVFVALLLIGTLVAACGGSGGDSGATEPEAPVATDGDTTAPDAGEETAAAEPGSCPDSARDQVVEMWSPLTGPDGDEMTALAQRFSSENEYGITVQHVPQPEYIQKLNAAAAAKQLPAMTIVRVINVGELAARNVLQPYSDEALAAVGSDLAGKFPDLAWAGGEYKEARYAIPLDIHPLVMYYNKDLFAQAGVAEPGSEPMSREEFEAALAALEAAGVTPISIGTAFQGATMFQSLIRQFGGSLTDEAGGQVSFASDAAVEALAYVNDLKQKYTPDVSGAGDPEVQLFKQGKAAIVIHGPWHISDLQRLPFTGFAPFPQIGDQYAVWAGSHQVALTTADPAQQAAAGCWVGWLSEHSVDWARAGQIPARAEARESAQLQEIAAPVAGFAASADSAIILPQVPELEGALWGEFGPVVDAVLMGEQADVKGALEQAAQRSQQILDENATRYAN